VAVERAVVLGHMGWVLLAHCAYLAVAGIIGMLVASRRMGRLLLH
jgi:lipooligosaccharide transport system permease protein